MGVSGSPLCHACNAVPARHKFSGLRAGSAPNHMLCHPHDLGYLQQPGLPRISVRCPLNSTGSSSSRMPFLGDSSVRFAVPLSGGIAIDPIALVVASPDFRFAFLGLPSFPWWGCARLVVRATGRGPVMSLPISRFGLTEPLSHFHSSIFFNETASCNRKLRVVGCWNMSEVANPSWES